MKTVSCYFPGPRFPSVSVTGSDCALRCPHCAGLPLSAMLPAKTPNALLSLARRLSEDGALGFLLSGGCDSCGVVPLGRFLGAIRSIKEETGLRINAHIGYPGREDLGRLVETGIDSFSVTFPMSDRIGAEVLGIENALSRYDEIADGPLKAGGRFVPHALIGLGDEQEDAAGLELLASYEPKSIVVIVFTPIKGTPLSDASPPADERIAVALATARELMPRANLVLGCMRPRGKTELEGRLIEETLDGIVMPSVAALRNISGRVGMKRLEGCCALYL